jgi:ABC-2 type transport system permease protein
MPQQYNQIRAMLAISKASIRAIFRSPSAVVFSFGFPVIFILVFGFIGGGGPVITFALKNQGDSNTYVIRALRHMPIVKLSPVTETTEMRKNLEKGRTAAILSIDSSISPAGFPQYTIHALTSSANADKYPILRMALAQTIQSIEENKMPAQFKILSVDELPVIHVRDYTMIDFILPGMLGFSLLSAGIFGVAFLFFNLRQQLVLKRFFATPISRGYIVMGEGISRVAFQLITAVVIIAMGHYVFKFTLVHGMQTFFEMITLSLFGLIIFMGFGFIVSSVSKNESSIPPLANLITLPQFLLGGTFFSTEAFPGWLRKICEALPLKQLNDALRNVAFEGASILDCGKQIGILLLWGIVVYTIAVKVFKWE